MVTFTLNLLLVPSLLVTFVAGILVFGIIPEGSGGWVIWQHYSVFFLAARKAYRGDVHLAATGHLRIVVYSGQYFCSKNLPKGEIILGGGVLVSEDYSFFVSAPKLRAGIVSTSFQYARALKEKKTDQGKHNPVVEDWKCIKNL